MRRGLYDLATAAIVLARGAIVAGPDGARPAGLLRVAALREVVGPPSQKLRPVLREVTHLLAQVVLFVLRTDLQQRAAGGVVGGGEGGDRGVAPQVEIESKILKRLITFWLQALKPNTANTSD